MKIFHSTFCLFLILIINTSICLDQSSQETVHNKHKKLEANYQEVLSLINKCKVFMASDNHLDKYKGRGSIGMLSQIAALYEVHIAFNALLTPEKKKLTVSDQETISKYLKDKSYSQENEALIESYLNCLLAEQSASYDIHSPQQSHINIPKKCHPLNTPIQRTMATENLARAGIQIDKNDRFF